MALWDSEGSDAYTLQYTVWCECFESARPIHLVVKNGVMESSRFLDSGEEAIGSLVHGTIDGLFDLVQEALDIKSYSLHVNYDSAFGFPTYINISYRHNVIDGGFYMEVHSYIPGPSQTPEPFYIVDLAKAELTSAMARWDSEGSDTYTLQYTLRCECPENARPIHLEVKNGVMESSRFLDSGEEATAAQGSYVVEDIDGLFDLVQDALEVKAYSLYVEYYSAWGVPAYIRITYAHNVADSELLMEVHSLALF